MLIETARLKLGRNGYSFGAGQTAGQCYVYNSSIWLCDLWYSYAQYTQTCIMLPI